jgi:hypothetical protein
MSYRYGDGSPSPFSTNVIELVKDATDCAVAVLLADDRLQKGRDRIRALEHAAEVEAHSLESLCTVVAGAIENVRDGAPPSTLRCLETILRAASEAVRTEVAAVRTAAAGEQGKVDAPARERAACVRALETLLLRHDLPGAKTDVRVQSVGGTRYGARLHAAAPFGVEWIVELETPPSHLFGHVLRLDKIVERLEIQAPEEVGLLHKELRLRLQRLEKHYVTELVVSSESVRLKLRQAPDGAGAGYDLTLGEASGLSMARIGEHDEVAPFEVAAADAARMRGIVEKLAVAARELVTHRKSLVQASLDGQPLKDHDRPGAFAERLISSIAPVVQSVAARSLSPTELVIKRMLADGRREEIFVERAELVRKLDPLPAAQRALFAPLGLDGGAPPVGSQSVIPDWAALAAQEGTEPAAALGGPAKG